MIIYGCSSTLYHPPFATIGLIIANVIIFAFSSSADPSTVTDYCLWYGDGIHPVQWLTSGFLHADAGHLIGNMFFLWPFGLLVEGKLGWWKFLVLYMGIVIGQNALEQTIMLGASSTVDVGEVMEQLSADPEFAEMSDSDREFFQMLVETQVSGEKRRSLGASAVIFGLLAVCMLWAPTSDFNIWWRLGTFEVPVLVVGGFYLLLEVYHWHSGGFAISSAALHLLGLVSGCVAGVIFLRLGVPNCDNEDLFNLLFDKSLAKPKKSKGKPTKPAASKLTDARELAAKKRLQTKPAIPPGMNVPPGQALGDITPDPLATAKPELTIDSGDPLEAARSLQTVSDPDELRSVPAADFAQAYQEANRAKQWSAAAVILQKWILAYPDKAEPRRLQLARIVLMALNKPDQAKKVLKAVQQENLNAEQKALFAKLVNKLRETKS